MSNYGIYKVHQEEGAIKNVMTLEKINDWESETEKEYSKDAIIKMIKSDAVVITITKCLWGNWVEGAKVIIENIDGTEYIKTVANDIKKDNLDNLPQYKK
jgi:hypothetical protein